MVVVDAGELEHLRHIISEGQAAMPVLEALWTLLLDDPELRHCLDIIVGGDVLNAVGTAERAVMGTIAGRRCELDRLRGRAAGPERVN